MLSKKIIFANSKDFFLMKTEFTDFMASNVSTSQQTVVIKLDDQFLHSHYFQHQRILVLWCWHWSNCFEVTSKFSFRISTKLLPPNLDLNSASKFYQNFRFKTSTKLSSTRSSASRSATQATLRSFELASSKAGVTSVKSTKQHTAVSAAREVLRVYIEQ